MVARTAANNPQATGIWEYKYYTLQWDTYTYIILYLTRIDCRYNYINGIETAVNDPAYKIIAAVKL